MTCAHRLLALSLSLSLCSTIMPLASQAAAQDATTSPAPAVVSGYPTVPPGYPTTTSPYGVRVSTHQAIRLRTLESDLNVLAARSDGRILDGSLSIAVGAAFITIGVFVDDALFRTLLLLTGGVAASRGVIELTVLPDADKPAIAFAQLPMMSSAQVIARLSYGEEALARLSRRTRLARLLDGSLTMLGAAAYVPIYTLARHNQDKGWDYGDDASDYIVAVFSGISLVAGLVTVIVKSPAERRYIDYRELKGRLAAEENGKTALRWPEVAPYASRDGAGIAAHMRF